MAGRLMSNFADAIEARTDDLVAAKTPAETKAVVQEAREEAVQQTGIPDTLIYRITVSVLGLAVLAVIVAQLWITLASPTTDIPEGLIAIGSAAIGALAGLLAPTPAS
jgi:hypothetical protein